MDPIFQDQIRGSESGKIVTGLGLVKIELFHTEETPTKT